MKTEAPRDRFTESDTIVVPAHPRGFHDVFLEERRWPNLKIDKRRLDSLKYIAVYQTGPVSAITHYGRIKSFKSGEKNGRYDVHLSGAPKELRHVPYTIADICALQGPRYTSLNRIQAADHLSSAFPT